MHQRGAPHMIAPEKLVDSARRLWGADMDRLWGEVVPVPERNLRVVNGDEQVTAGGRTFEIAYTPGHASHHVSYYEPSSGVAFVGDTAGMSVDGGYVLPPTPPPDIDIELWRGSVSRIERLGAGVVVSDALRSDRRRQAAPGPPARSPGHHGGAGARLSAGDRYGRGAVDAVCRGPAA